MRLAVYYYISLVWGLITPALAGVGAEYAMAALRPDASPPGRATPMEFLLLFAGAAFLCALLFLVFNIVFARFILPEGSPRTRHFLLNLLIYLLMCLGGWALGVCLAGWLGL